MDFFSLPFSRNPFCSLARPDQTKSIVREVHLVVCVPFSRAHHFTNYEDTPQHSNFPLFHLHTDFGVLIICIKPSPTRPYSNVLSPSFQPIVTLPAILTHTKRTFHGNFQNCSVCVPMSSHRTEYSRCSTSFHIASYVASSVTF